MQFPISSTMARILHSGWKGSNERLDSRNLLPNEVSAWFAILGCLRDTQYVGPRMRASGA